MKTSQKACYKNYNTPEYRQKQREKYQRNKIHICEMQKKWRLRNPERLHEINLNSSRRQKYKISPEQIETMYKAQGGRCAICCRPMTKGQSVDTQMHLDHNHETGINRELLCKRCNLTLGKVYEDVDLLQAMINYLNKHKTFMMTEMLAV